MDREMEEQIVNKRLLDFQEGKIRRTMLSPDCYKCYDSWCSNCDIFKDYLAPRKSEIKKASVKAEGKVKAKGKEV